MLKANVKDDSLEKQGREVYQAFNAQFSLPMPEQAWVAETYPDYLICESGGKYYKVGYRQDGEDYVFDTKDKWQEVEQKSEWVEKVKALKVGARHSSSDREMVQTIHDHATSLGAECAPADGKSLDPDTEVITYGSEVKAVKLDDGRVKLGGYLVRFSSPDDPDLTADYFTRDTDRGEATKSTVWFNHRMPVEYDGKSVTYTDSLGEAELKEDETGVFAEVVLGARNAYEKLIGELGLAGKLGWSSGTASHLVDRKASTNGTYEITRWPLGLDASLTPQPAEPRNAVTPLKSLIGPAAALPEVVEKDDSLTHSNKETDMNEDERKALLAEFQQMAAATAADAAEQAVKKYAESAGPEIKAGFAITEVEDEADRASKGNPFKNGGEFLKAVYMAETYSEVDKRLLPLKATGLNEAIPSQGGYLLPKEVDSTIRSNMYQTGTILNLFSFDNVSGNSMTYNVVDETSRANGSRYGGLQGYWLAEAGTKQGSKPSFRQAELRLKKVAALCYATDELLEDVGALESWLTRTVPNELRFMAEDAIINGDGIGKPLGILQGPAVKSAVRTNANLIDAADIGRMWAARFAGYTDYVWLGNQSIFSSLLVMSIGNQPAFVPMNQGIVGETPARLLGRPFYETEYNPALGTLGDLLLTSPSAYLGIQKGGVQSASSIHVQFVTDETAFRFVFRIDGQPEWDSLLTLKDTNTVSPYVALAATT